MYCSTILDYWKNVYEYRPLEFVLCDIITSKVAYNNRFENVKSVPTTEGLKPGNSGWLVKTKQKQKENVQEGRRVLNVTRCSHYATRRGRCVHVNVYLPKVYL